METIATTTTTTLSDVFKGLGLNALPQYLPTLLDEARLYQRQRTIDPVTPE
jgi:hypothetical protein